MKVYLNNIRGVEDALTSLYMSKRSWTREKEEEVRKMIKESITPEGFLNTNDPEVLKQIDKLITYGVKHGHTTLLRYIDLSFTVEGLHRGAQDDFDSHVKRLDSRIVRSSTRLATFSNGEKSDYYKGKVLYPFEAFEIAGIELPKEITYNKEKYVVTDFGYIREDLFEDKDAKRGLYPLGIPSNFIFKVQYPELSHIIQSRDNSSHANPELKEAAEAMKALVCEKFPPLGKYINEVIQQPAGRIDKKWN